MFGPAAGGARRPMDVLEGVRSGWSHGPAPAGVRVLVPGWPQWRWRQVERAMALFGTFGAALLVGLFAWGTAPGWFFVAVAILTHVVSTADAIRQGSFPGYTRWVSWWTASAGLGLVYVPALLILVNLACPVALHGADRGAVLINRWAYRGAAAIEPGQWVYHRGGGGRDAPGGLGRVRARSGEEVEWVDGRLRIGGELQEWLPRDAVTPSVRGLLMKVPQGHVLVEPHDPAAGPWLIVPEAAIEGRAWALHEPIWARRWLP